MGIWKWGLLKNQDGLVQAWGQNTSKHKLFNLFLLCSLLLVFLSTALCWAMKEPFHGFQFNAHHIRAADSARLVVVEMVGNEEGDIVVLHPGYVETAATFRGMVEFFLKEGKKVYVAQSRFVGQGNLRSGGNRSGPNGLAQVLVTDSQAVWDFVISKHPHRKFHVVGHSMGGGQIIAGTADPSRGKWFQQHIASRALITPLHTIHKMPLLITRTARFLKPLLELALKYNIYYIAPHHVFYGAARGMSQAQSPLARAIAEFLADKISRIMTLIFNGLLIDGKYTSIHEFREVIFTASGFSVDLLLGWVNAVLAGEVPVPMNAGDTDVPTLVAAAEKDRLLVLDGLKDLMKELEDSPTLLFRKWVLMKGAHHVDPVSSQLLMRQLLPLIRDFQNNPEASTNDGAASISLKCEDVLLVGV